MYHYVYTYTRKYFIHNLVDFADLLIMIIIFIFKKYFKTYIHFHYQIILEILFHTEIYFQYSAYIFQVNKYSQNFKFVFQICAQVSKLIILKSILNNIVKRYFYIFQI